MTRASLAEELFNATLALALIEERLANLIESCIGDVDYDDRTWDYYDCSFELKGAPDDLRWPAEKLAAVWDAGFSRFWICHRDGWETAYARGHAEGFRKKGHVLVAREAAP